MNDKLTFLGHAAFLLETNGINVLIDPFLSGNPEAAVNAQDLQADYILVTHAHGDHIGDTIQIAARCNATVIANNDLKNWFLRQGVKKALPLYHSGQRELPFGTVKAVQALHGSCTPDNQYGGLALGFIVTTKKCGSIYFAGDTGLFGDMALIGEEGIDTAILPIGDIFTMGPDEALHAVKLIHPKQVIPMHYTLPTGGKIDPYAWAEQVNAQAESTALVLQPGESLDLQKLSD